jgi:hypothetical protein
MVDSALHKVNENVGLQRVCGVFARASGRGFYVASGIRQTKSKTWGKRLVLYLLIVALMAASAGTALWMRDRHVRRRQQAISALLDSADAVESQLQACRERMQRLRSQLSILPEEMSARADSALSADFKVQAALKDLLAHRLWIQQHAETATIAQFDAARSALEQSGTTLAALLQRLDDAASELERAQAIAREAGRRST